MTRTQITVFVLVAIVALVLGLTVNKVLNSKGQNDPTALLDAGIVLLPQSRTLPELSLIDQDGQTVAVDQLKEQWSLLFFGYTFCPDICPTTLVEMAEILKQLGDDADRLQGIFVSVDPERDTPAALATYTRFFDPRIIGLTGSPALIQGVARNFKVRYAKVARDTGDPKLYAVDHSAGLYLLGPDSRFIKKYGYGTPAQAIADELRDLIRQP